MIRVIVTTTINAPTEAIYRYDNIAGWDLIVIGDRATPQPYRLNNGIYLSVQDQEAMDKRLSDLIGWNCIQRRNIGLLAAWRAGADVIALVDDDNIPKKSWGTDIVVGKRIEVTRFITDEVAFDPLGAINYPELWHRGFPLQLVRSRDYHCCERTEIEPDIEASLWDDDPDVDAVCRMLYSPTDCCFGPPELFPFTSTTISPFNSQNTFLTRRVLPHFFLFPGIGRMDDIWASYYVQALGFRVVYSQPTVTHIRNPHNLSQDFDAECIGYKTSLPLLQALQTDSSAIFRFLPKKALRAFERYQYLMKVDKEWLEEKNSF